MVQTKHGEINVPIPGMTFDDGGAATIYVGNVHSSITIDQIVQFFTAVCGEVPPSPPNGTKSRIWPLGFRAGF